MNHEIVIVNVNKDGLWGPSLKDYLKTKGMDVYYVDKSAKRYPDGLYFPRYTDEELKRINNKDVYIVGTPNPDDTPDNVMDKMKRNSLFLKNKNRELNARNIIFVTPYYPYGRADKDIRNGKKYIGEANLIETNYDELLLYDVNAVISVDVHNPNEIKERFEKIKFVNIEMTELYYRYILNNSYAARKRNDGKNYFADGGKDIVVTSTDARGYEKMMNLYQRFKRSFPKINFMAFEKIRYAPSNPSMLEVKLREKSDDELTLDNKLLILIEDIIETGGTVDNTMKVMGDENFTSQYGKFRDAIFIATHAPLAMYYKNWDKHLESIRRLRNMPFNEIVFTNTLDYIKYMLYVDEENRYINVAEKRFDIENHVDDYHDLQKRLTFIELFPSVGKAIIQLDKEINGGKIKGGIDNMERAFRGKKDKIEMPFEILRGSEYRTRQD